jgi:toxin ParE1/3/4
MNSKKDKMKYKVNFVSEAEEDLFQIYKYVYLNDSEEQAEQLYSKLYEKCLLLQEFPERGHIPPELNLLDIEDFLEIHYKPYRIIYRIIKREVFINCIIDGRRDIQKLLQERLLR